MRSLIFGVSALAAVASADPSFDFRSVLDSLKHNKNSIPTVPPAGTLAAAASAVRTAHRQLTALQESQGASVCLDPGQLRGDVVYEVRCSATEDRCQSTSACEAEWERDKGRCKMNRQVAGADVAACCTAAGGAVVESSTCAGVSAQLSQLGVTDKASCAKASIFPGVDNKSLLHHVAATFGCCADGKSYCSDAAGDPDSISTECTDAMRAYGATSEKTCEPAFDFESSALTSDQREAALCTANTGCIDALRGVFKACSADLDKIDPSGNFRRISVMVNAFRALCPTGTDAGCFRAAIEYEGKVKALDFDDRQGKMPTQDQIRSLCEDKCTNRIIKFQLRMVQLTGDNIALAEAEAHVSGRRVVCTKDRKTGHYCYPDLKLMSRDDKFTPAKVCPNICVRRAFLEYASSFEGAGARGDFKNFFRFMCAKNGDKYCPDLMDEMGDGDGSSGGDSGSASSGGDPGDDPNSVCTAKDNENMGRCLAEANTKTDCTDLYTSSGEINQGMSCACANHALTCYKRSISLTCLSHEVSRGCRTFLTTCPTACSALPAPASGSGTDSGSGSSSSGSDVCSGTVLAKCAVDVSSRLCSGMVDEKGNPKPEIPCACIDAIIKCQQSSIPTKCWTTNDNFYTGCRTGLAKTQCIASCEAYKPTTATGTVTTGTATTTSSTSSSSSSTRAFRMMKKAPSPAEHLFSDVVTRAASRRAAIRHATKVLAVRNPSSTTGTRVGHHIRALQDGCDAVSSGTCSAGCQAEVDKAKAVLGCCIADMAQSLARMSLGGHFEELRQLAGMVRAIGKACNVDTSAAAMCAKRGKVKGKLALAGLDKATVDANKDEFYADFASDLSGNIGVPEDNIKVTGHAAIAASTRRVTTLQSAGVAFNYEISTEDDASAAAVKEELNAEVESGSLELPATSSEIAKTNPEAASSIAVDKSNSKASAVPSETTATSPATKTTPSGLALAIAAATAAVVFFAS